MGIKQEVINGILKILRVVRGRLSHAAYTLRQTRSFKRVVSVTNQVITPLRVQYLRVPYRIRVPVLFVAAVAVVLGGFLYNQERQYELSSAEQKLLGKVSIDQKLLKETDKGFEYNRSEEEKEKGKSVVLAAAKTEATGQFPYKVTLPKNISEGVTFSDDKGDLSFKVIPQFGSSEGRQSDGRVRYAKGNNELHVYTLKRNGIKQDIVVREGREDSLTYNWKLETGDKLEAKMLPDGSIGLYSANPYLYGNVQVSDDKSRDLINNARKNGQKTNLAFVMPAPYIIDANGTKLTQNVRWQMEKDNLTLKATGLKGLSYPLSIDPTIVVTTMADFKRGSDDGSIDYGTADQIGRRSTTSGAVGSISTSYFNVPRNAHSTVAANGYLYITGGRQANSDTACVNTGVANVYCNDIQRMAINADGSLGAIFTSYFNIPRSYPSTVAANGYLYITGGYHSASDTACVNTGVATNYCNDIQRMAISSVDGSLGAITTSYFNVPRSGHSTVASNGYLYIAGGSQSASDTACVNTAVATNRCNDIQRLSINADGSLGATISTSYFNVPRYGQSAVAANGYLYITGGFQSASDTACVNTGVANFRCNDIQRMAISSVDGSLGAITTSYFNVPRHGQSAVASGGYLYITGGQQSASDTACVNTGVATNYCNDIQRLSINADGSLGAISTSYFNFPRNAHSAVAAGGYLYITGGFHSTSDTACVNTGVATSYCNDIQRAPLGMSVPDSGTTSYFNVPRNGHSAVAAGGYLYIIGGYRLTSDTACVNTGVATQYCNDIQRMAISSVDGSLGAISTSYFNFPRSAQSAVASGGYLYISGGFHSTSDTACVNTGVATQYCNDIQRMAISSVDGSLGAISTSYFNFPRDSHSAVAANGYLYITGGYQSASNTACVNTGVATSFCNDIQRMAISSVDGSLGTISTSYFNFPRDSHSAVAANGYLYITGGSQSASNTACVNTGVTTNYCNDIQRLSINADGSLGTISTSYFNLPRYGHSAVAANGYLYITGGNQPASDTACVNTGVATSFCNDIQRLSINADGSLGTISTSYFNVPRYDSSAVAAGGYLYITGGQQAASDTACVNTGVANIRCNDIQRVEVGPKSSVGSFSASYFNVPRYNHSAVAANGYLYITGGYHSTSDTACVNTGVANFYCNDIQRMAINADGSLGTISTSYFNLPRYAHSAVAAGGYLYITGGYHSTSDTACVNTGVATNYCNDIQRLSINADGSLGAISTSYFNFPRSAHFAVAANGYLYITGGVHPVSDTACVNTGVADLRCNDIQRMATNADGSLGAISTSYFNVPRSLHSTVAANGYLYITGGQQTNSTTNCVNTGVADLRCNDIQRMATNADGSLGAISTSYFNVPRAQHSTVAANGYLYITGGRQSTSDTACVNTGVANTYCNDIQRMATNADGSLGTISTSYFNLPRINLSTAAANGYLYITGGYHSASNTDCVNTGVANTDCNDIQRSLLGGPINKGEYERLIDIGGVSTLVSSITFTGTANCNGLTIQYKTAGGNSIFGAVTEIKNARSGTSYAINRADVRYIFIKLIMDDISCGSVSNVTDITLTYSMAPTSPTLIAPVASVIGLGLQPQFQLRSSDPNSDYLRYKIELCSTSDCLTVLRTIDQTVSQTGWTGQDTQTGTAYIGSSVLSSSTIATHNYQTPALTLSTQYWWRAYGIDPAGDNAWGAVSAIQSFTTQSIPAAPTLSEPSGTNVPGLPVFALRTTDADSDYLRYKIELCSNSTCSIILRTIDQTASQTGWTGQDAQSITAYTSSNVITNSKIASYTLQSPALVPSQTYWWRATAIDPAGTNTFSTASTINSFTVGTNEKQIRGGVEIRGGTRFGN